LIGRLNTRARMEEFEVLLFMACLCFFTAWVSYLTNRLNQALDTIDHSGGELEEIRGAVEIVGQILNQLPEMLKSGVPEFHLNSSPLTPIFEAIARNLSGEQPLKAYEATRDAEGRFNAPPKIEEENPTT